MHPLVERIPSSVDARALGQLIADRPGAVLLESARLMSGRGRYSFVAADPFTTFRSYGSRCEIQSGGLLQTQYGDPWKLLDALLARCELLEEIDLPFPLGGCFGFWGYDLKNFVEPKLNRTSFHDLDLPDCAVGFYDSLVVADHELRESWIVSTGLDATGARCSERARAAVEVWVDRLRRLKAINSESRDPTTKAPVSRPLEFVSSLSREAFIEKVERAQRYIRAGDIYQVNLAQRLTVDEGAPAWGLYQELSAVSPAPYAAFFNAGDFSIVSSSPELFLRMSGSHVVTRPIKGTRPRSPDPLRDAQLGYELQTSAKEMSELVMITDLMRNDLGRVCEYGSIHVPELAQLERYSHVQHLVSTVEGRLRPGPTHLAAFAQCFPGGSITGAPKIRAMEIIEELEPVSRGPYTGALGYLGFNRETQLSILIRAALCCPSATHIHVGAGIVADSDPSAEYEETLAKAAGIQIALQTVSDAARREARQTSRLP
ncbi:MAG: anthranilate synthase component I family protein [Verrucomicrobia bacterium]|nr:anthranilate synthase component I family protein [Verrucomicrobiota bacterium]MBI3871114.1 anthranilate synthase component I family protein [Verrucomicrobiota bacterium]